MSKDKAVFVYKIDVGGKSPHAAREAIAQMMENCSITLSDVEVQNIWLPVKNQDSSVECIYPVPGGTVTKIVPEIKFSKTKNVKSPTRGTSQSAGIDFFIPDDWNDGLSLYMNPNSSVLIPSGIKVNVPEGYALIAFNKSGIATKKNLQVGACVAGDTIIQTNKGKFKASDLTKDFVDKNKIKIASVNTDGEVEFKECDGFRITGNKPSYRITFEDASEIIVSEDHFMFEDSKKMFNINLKDSGRYVQKYQIDNGSTEM